MIRGFRSAWKEVRPILLGLILVIALDGWLKTCWLGGFAFLLLLAVVFFFRDPDRTPASFSPAAILSPADGEVVAIEEIDDNGQKYNKVSIFLSLLNVHVQRSPVAGVVNSTVYTPGGFAPAYKEEARQNESNLILIDAEHGFVSVKQMTGVLARRIVCWVKAGQPLKAGQHLGLIKFGSRVELTFPNETEILVKNRQAVFGGQTVIARWKE